MTILTLRARELYYTAPDGQDLPTLCARAGPAAAAESAPVVAGGSPGVLRERPDRSVGSVGFVQAYNAQVAVNELQLIVGQAVTQETNDKKQLMPMITTIEQQSGDTPSQLLADAGYCSDVNLTAIADTDIDAYISTRKQKHGERPGPCPRGPLPKTATIVDQMSRQLHNKTGAAVYAARKGIVEPVIGQIKQARGFRQFLLRGFEKVQGEWSLVCTTHNILKLYRLCM